PTSPDTLLRRVKSALDEPAPPPRYIGVDDWAIRKCQHYGTIIIDVKRRCVIDLLPGRDDEALKGGLTGHPGVEVIARDRWPAYANPAMVRQQLTQSLPAWLKRVEASVSPDLVTFAAGLRADEAAVTAALTEVWSSGQVEGQVNRLK